MIKRSHKHHTFKTVGTIRCTRF